MTTKTKTRAARSYGGESHAERRTRRDTQFLDAGKVIFGDHGFQAAKVRDICAEAGLTERYYYESFGDLRDLFEAVYFRELGVLRHTLDRALAGATRKPEAMAHTLIESYFTLLRTDTRLARILIVEIYGAAANIKGLYRRGVKQFADRFGLLVALGLDGAADSGLDPGLISTALVGIPSSLAMRWYLGGYREPQEKVVANCYAVFSAVIKMISADPGTALPGKRR